MPEKKEKKSSIAQNSPRKLKAPDYRSFSLRRRNRPKKNLASAFRILRLSLAILKKHWKLFGGITLVYGVLTILLVHGLGSNLDINQLKQNVSSTFGEGSSISTSASLFSYLVGSGGNAQSEAGGVYQACLILITSLALIWALRQVLADKNTKVKSAFYSGMYPIIPFILVLVVISLQMLPLIIGSWLYSTVVGNSIAASTLEQLLWGMVFLLLAAISIYMICSSIFALYSVTLPDMTPLKALRTTRQLVRFRRLQVIRKLIFLPIFLLIVGAVIIIPIIMVVPVLAEWVFFVLTIASLAVIHSYLYTLYRELI